MRTPSKAFRLGLVFLLAAFTGCGFREEEGVRPEDPQAALLEELAANLNPEVEGLGPFFELWENRDLAAAQQALLDYFRGREIPQAVLPADIAVEQAMLVSALDAWRGTFTFQGLRGQAGSPEGPIDWSYKGPKGDNEWAWFLHRHAFLREMLVLYEVQGHDEFAQRIGEYLVDWFWRFPPPDHRSFSASWRALEAARRYVDSWLPVYAGLRGNPALGDEAELAIIAGAARHANYLQNHHHFGGNHLVTEMMGLASIAVAWPEFKSSGQWLDYAVDRSLEELDRQVYPDGAHKELANHYQWIAGTSFQRLFEVLVEADAVRAVERMEPSMERIWDYYAWVVRPDGTGPLNNDSDLEPNAEQLLPLAELYDRPDWLYIATGGVEGTAPAGPLSRVYPWAGQAILRTSWGELGDWVFFDAGPYGSDHQQRDRLHLSASLFGRNFLVDSGRFVYRDDAWADYFRGPNAHNVATFERHERVVPDAVTQAPQLDMADLEGPLPLASGSIPLREKGSLSWSGIHSRKVGLGRGFVWVVDRLDLARPDRATFRWHFHPDLTLRADGDLWNVFQEDTPVAQWIVAATTPLAVEAVSGVERGDIQGWYSPEYNQRIPNEVLQYQTGELTTGVLAWVLVAQESGISEVKLSVTPSGAQLQFVRNGTTESFEVDLQP